MAKTILVVDDEPGIVTIVRDYLEKAGFRVLTAGGGATAATRRTRGRAAPLLARGGAGARSPGRGGGPPVELTATEFDLLAVLARHPGRPFTRAQLVESVYNDSFEGYERTIDAHIK